MQVPIIAVEELGLRHIPISYGFSAFFTKSAPPRSPPLTLIRNRTIISVTAQSETVL